MSPMTNSELTMMQVDARGYCNNTAPGHLVLLQQANLALLLCLAANWENRSHMKSHEQTAQYKKPLQVMNWKTLASSFQCVLDGSCISSNNHDTKTKYNININKFGGSLTHDFVHNISVALNYPICYEHFYRVCPTQCGQIVTNVVFNTYILILI